MGRKMWEDFLVCRKHPANPLLRPCDLPGPCMSVFNPGAIKHNGEYLLIADVLSLQTKQFFWMARSPDGVKFRFDDAPLPWPRFEEDELREFSVYDPRITPIDDGYVLTYARHNKQGMTVGMARTRDFENFELLPSGGQVRNRNGVLFPEKIGGKYVRLERPGDPAGRCAMGLSTSADLVHWADYREVMGTHTGWAGTKIGAGAVPIKTEKGWLCIYHGVKTHPTNSIYRLGVCLLDLADPSRVVARGEDCILWPEYDYEFVGRVPNVVFTCGAVVEADRSVKIYYGAADTCIGLAETHVDALLEVCFTPNKFILQNR